MLLLAAVAAEAQSKVATFPARDTLQVRPDGDARAQAMLDALRWEPGAFEVTAVAEGAEVRVEFPSPRPRGVGAGVDTVVLEWFVARDAAGRPVEAPAVVVIHTIHPDMPIGRAVARLLAAEGFHAFMMQMPEFGRRWSPTEDDARSLFPRLTQAIADARRARDAVAALPNVKPGPVAIEGTSLGGIVAVNAAALDGGGGVIGGADGGGVPAFDPVLLAFTGADLRRVMTQGLGDAAFLRQRLARGGISGDRLLNLADAIEPARLAHRLNPRRTWLFTASNDLVFPEGTGDTLAKAIGLPADHVVAVRANHYTAVLQLPWVVRQMAAVLRGEPKAAAASP